MRQGFKTSPGVSWDDVKLVIEDFEQEFKCRLQVIIELPGMHGTAGNQLKVYGHAEVQPSSIFPSWQRDYRLSWPSMANKSMPSLVMRLIWEFAEHLRIHPPKPGKAQTGIIAPRA